MRKCPTTLDWSSVEWNPRDWIWLYLYQYLLRLESVKFTVNLPGLELRLWEWIDCGTVTVPLSLWDRDKLQKLPAAGMQPKLSSPGIWPKSTSHGLWPKLLSDLWPKSVHKSLKRLDVFKFLWHKFLGITSELFKKKHLSRWPLTLHESVNWRILRNNPHSLFVHALSWKDTSWPPFGK